MKYIYLSFFVVGCIVLFFSLRIPDKKINAKVLFINQVRGEECCQKGSYDFTKQQLALFKKHGFPATFVLRYDVLNNDKFIALLKACASERFNYGIFFEITPRLAKDAEITYKGSEERWYRAQYAYLVGYSQEERKKLIDTAMSLFKRRFGYYPKTTGGWMIDTYSAEYLTSAYGVDTHEITREQWGTDGYVLYGGSLLSAYVPSKKWLFVPAPSEGDNTLPLLVIRQTLSDPVRNYGDLTSGYTSQPNDFGRTKEFDYFKHLLRQVEQYSQPLAVLGLENSLDEKYQDIYENQVSYISEVIERKNVILPKDITKINRTNYAIGTDFTDKTYKAFWIETPGYRARIIQKNDYIQLTDLRVFDESLKDPYYLTASGEKTAYWEVPYIFDSSKNGVHEAVSTLSYKIGAIFQFFGNFDWLRERTSEVVNERFLSEINGMIFPRMKRNSPLSIEEKEGTIFLRYVRENGKEVLFTFREKDFTVKGVKNNEYEIKGSIGRETDLIKEQKDNEVLFTPQLNPTQPNDLILPEKKEEDKGKPTFVTIGYNAPLSLIGRNPARLVVVSKDSGGRPTRINNMQITYVGGNFDSVKIHETEGHLGEFDGIYYIDIEQKKAGTYSPILMYDTQRRVLKPISFVIDCKKNLKTCLLSPRRMFDYMRVKIEDVLNRR